MKNLKNKLKLVVLLLICMNIFNVSNSRALSNIVPSYGNFGFLQTNQQYLDNFVNYTLENGVQAVKNRKGVASSSTPIMLYSSGNNTVRSDIIFYEIMFDMQILVKELNNSNYIRILSASQFCFCGVYRDLPFTIEIKKEGNSYIMLFVHRNSFILNFTQYISSKYLSLLIYFDMLWAPNENRNYGSILSKAFVSNSSTETIQIDNYRNLGLWSASPDNCYIEYSNIAIYFFPPSIPWETTYSQLEKSMLLFARSLYYILTNPTAIVLPDLPIYRESLLGKTIDFIAPTLETYWNYTSFRLETQSVENVSFSRNYTEYNESTNDTIEKTYEFNYNYNLYYVKSQINQFYYTTQTINSEDWGNWVVRIRALGGIIDYEMSFNWFRDLIVRFLNTMIFLIQIVLYLLTIAFNYLLVWLFLQIIVLLWNYPIKWLVYAVIGIVFWISFFFVWFWNQIVIVWKQIIEPIITWLWDWLLTRVIIPFVTWLRNDGLRQLVNLYLTWTAFMITVILFVLTLGAIDFNETWNVISNLLIQINNFVFEFMNVFLENFVLFLGFGATYILLIGLIYIKYIYTKSRGYITRSNRLQTMINVYKLPVVLVIRLVQYVIGFIQGGVPTDGAQDK